LEGFVEVGEGGQDAAVHLAQEGGGAFAFPAAIGQGVLMLAQRLKHPLGSVGLLPELGPDLLERIVMSANNWSWHAAS
jgi:hypothetical protein